MTDIDSSLKQAAIDAKKLPQKPDNDTLLQLYALYKQGSIGDVAGDRPGFFDFVAVAKFEAWEGIRGRSQDDAKQQYIDLVQKLSRSTGE